MPWRMPAEWEPHEATWLAWPHEKTDWPGKFTPIPWVYGEIVRKLSQVEIVRILADPERITPARRVLEKCGANLNAVEFVECPTDRSWTRDYCPTFVKNEAGAIAACGWRFNAWAKYSNYTRDCAAPACIAQRLGVELLQPGFVLEGGGIEVNGAGALLTTEEWLLSDTQVRNPGFTRERYEELFREWLGVTDTVWLKNGIVGDDTHGHIDDLARFTGPSTVVIAVEDDPLEANYFPLRENLEILRARQDLKVVELPMPRPLYFDGQRLPASYANFYIANSLVLVPTFNDPADREALRTLAKLFPDREVCGIHAIDLVLGLGTLHCLTQHQPA
ncbi:MAG: agmatine deiminase family protein [Bryobacteraceae bacterium]|nr:agmatine deiminase family protein [Bryobacteraceae bacterium]